MSMNSIFAPGLFYGKSAIVTGGGTGIGRAIATELAYLGCNVCIASRDDVKLQKTCEDVNSFLEQHNKSSKPMFYKQCNIRKGDEVVSLVQHVVKKMGRVDILVNNGGGQFPSPLENITEKGWNAVVDTNLTGTFLCMREAYKQSMKTHGGSIINIIMDIYKGFPYMSHSTAARAGVESLTKSLAVEWAPNGVTINAIAPGVIYSETAVANYGETGKEMFINTAKEIPMKRLGKPEEISAAACYLLSPAASYISGQTLYVDGAISLYRPQAWVAPDHNNSETFTWDGTVPPKPKM